jgi:hypothetical protein
MKGNALIFYRPFTTDSVEEAQKYGVHQNGDANFS